MSALVLARKASNRRLLSQVVEQEGLSVDDHGEPADVAEAIETSPLPTLALVDIDGFSSEIWDVCRTLTRQEVPVVVIAGSRTDEVQEATLDLGVRTVLEKPLRQANLKALVRTMA